MSSRPNILDRIVETKRAEVARLPEQAIDGALLREAVERRGGARDFFGALANPRVGSVGLIAEVKKASPSAGIIRPDFDPVTVAQTYESGGASCLSVLTDVDYFQGSLDYLKAIRETVDLPLLRKDFMIDPRQILEAIEYGADAILLIMAILDDATLKGLHDLANEAGLTALVEVHDEEELERAMAIDARLIGVNNRNLKEFTVDLGTTERLADRIRAQVDDGSILLVAESGIHTGSDVARLRAAGSRAILVGESLMRQDDIPAKMRELVG